MCNPPNEGRSYGRGLADRGHGSAGQGIIEYGLILGLSALFALVILVVFGGPLAGALDVIGDLIDG